MRTLLELLGKRGIMFIVLMLVMFPVIKMGLDSRIGMSLAGVIFMLNGAGQILLAQKSPKGARASVGKGTGIFMIVFGMFTLIVMIIMLAIGQELGSPPS